MGTLTINQYKKWLKIRIPWNSQNFWTLHSVKLFAGFPVYTKNINSKIRLLTFLKEFDYHFQNSILKIPKVCFWLISSETYVSHNC